MLMEMVTQVRASDTILITAVTGGVGKIFAQWAKSLGVQVIGTVGSKEKLALGKSFGCDYTLTYDQPDFIDEIFDFNIYNLLILIIIIFFILFLIHIFIFTLLNHLIFF